MAFKGGKKNCSVVATTPFPRPFYILNRKGRSTSAFVVWIMRSLTGTVVVGHLAAAGTALEGHEVALIVSPGRLTAAVANTRSVHVCGWGMLVVGI